MSKTVRAGGVAVLSCLVAACGTTVSGTPVASRNPVSTVQADSGLARLLPAAAQFPSRYAAVILPPEAAGQAANDLDGILAGAAVEPGSCVPSAPSAGPAVIVGTDDATRATLTVELVRIDQPLAKLRDQLQRCGTVRVAHGGTTVTTELDPPPPLDADDTLALRRTVRSESGSAGSTRSMQTLLGQVGDVRINVTHMSFNGTPADAEALDSLFTATVSKVRKG